MPDQIVSKLLAHPLVDAVLVAVAVAVAEPLAHLDLAQIAEPRTYLTGLLSAALRAAAAAVLAYLGARSVVARHE